jgi:hypothetical protein
MLSGLRDAQRLDPSRMRTLCPEGQSLVHALASWPSLLDQPMQQSHIMLTPTRRMFATMTVAAFIVNLVGSKVAWAQPAPEVDSTGGMTCHCPMAGMHGMAIAGMIIGMIFVLLVIAVLIALVVFLLRRSRTHVP